MEASKNNKVLKNIFTVSLIVFNLFFLCQSPYQLSVFVTSYTLFIDPLRHALINGIFWSSRENNIVKVLLANLYYSKCDDGEVRCIIGSENHPGYDFESIYVNVSDLSGVSYSFLISNSEFSLKENGILLNNAKRASINDFKLYIDIYLDEFFTIPSTKANQLQVNICYENKLGDGTSKLLKYVFCFDAKTSGMSFTLSNVSFDS